MELIYFSKICVLLIGKKMRLFLKVGYLVEKFKIIIIENNFLVQYFRGDIGLIIRVMLLVYLYV